MATVADKVECVRAGVGNVRTAVDRQYAVGVGVVLLVRDIRRVVEAEGTHARDLVPGAVTSHGEEGSRLIRRGGDVRRASGVAGGAGVVLERLREDAHNGHQLAVTGRDPVDAQGFAGAGSAELGDREEMVDQWGMRSVGGVHPGDLGGPPEAGQRV